MSFSSTSLSQEKKLEFNGYFIKNLKSKKWTIKVVLTIRCVRGEASQKLSQTGSTVFKSNTFLKFYVVPTIKLYHFIKKLIESIVIKNKYFLIFSQRKCIWKLQHPFPSKEACNRTFDHKLHFPRLFFYLVNRFKFLGKNISLLEFAEN